MEKITYTAYGIFFLLFVGCGWSLAEQPTWGKALIAIVCFFILMAGAKFVNRYAE